MIYWVGNYSKEYENKVKFNENIQLKNIQAGLYLLTVIDGERKEVKKLVIKYYKKQKCEACLLFLFSVKCRHGILQSRSPKDFITLKLLQISSGSAAFPHRPSLQGRNRFVFLLNSSLIPNRVY
jgi:hypothetical protein